MAQAALFADVELRPYAKEFELKEALPRTLIEEMARRGYLAPSLPVEYGGLGLNPLQYGQFVELFGKACNSVRELITVHNSLVGETLLRFGSKVQKEQWLARIGHGDLIAAFALSEPNVGTDAQRVETTYCLRDGHYVLNGTKKWISFAGIADVFLLIAAQDNVVSAFLVERESPGLSITPMNGLLASKASHIAEIHLHDVAVPKEQVVGPIGGGFTYVTSYALDQGRYSVAWGGVALAQAALEAMIAYAHRRSQFGKTLGEFDLIRAAIGDAAARIHGVRALCQHAGMLRMKKDFHALMETTMAKYLAAQVAMAVTTQAVQLHGGNGFSNDYPVERYFREAKLLEIIEGTTQILSLVIGQQALATYSIKHS